MQEARFQALRQKDPQEKEMATHSWILVCEIPWRGQSGGLQSMGLQELGMTEQLNHLELAACESEVKGGPETLHLWLTLEVTAVLWGLCLVPVQFASLLYVWIDF